MSPWTEMNLEPAPRFNRRVFLPKKPNIPDYSTSCKKLIIKKINTYLTLLFSAVLMILLVISCGTEASIPSILTFTLTTSVSPAEGGSVSPAQGKISQRKQTVI
jgi:hypothetical protein